MVELEEKIFKTQVLRWLENAILTLVFASTVNTSYMLLQQLHKHYKASTHQKLPTFDDVMTQFCLNFFKVLKFWCVTHRTAPFSAYLIAQSGYT